MRVAFLTNIVSPYRAPVFRRLAETPGWSLRVFVNAQSEFDRPIYFLETRDGYACCWCSRAGDKLILQPHHGSPNSPEIVDYNQDIDIIGQVIGVAMHLTPESAPPRPARRRTRAVSVPK